MGTAFSTIKTQKKYNKKNDETKKSDSNIHIPTFSSCQVIVQPKLDCTEAGDMYEQEADQDFNFDNSIGAASNDIEAVKALMELFALDEVPENAEELKLINEQINSLNDPTLNALIIMLSKNYDKVIDES